VLQTISDHIHILPELYCATAKDVVENYSVRGKIPNPDKTGAAYIHEADLQRMENFAAAMGRFS